MPKLVWVEFRTVGIFWIDGLLGWLSGLPEFVEDLEEVVTLGDGVEVGVYGLDFDEVRVGVGVGVDRSWVRSWLWLCVGVLLGSTVPSESESVAQDLLPARLVVLEGVDSFSSGLVLVWLPGFLVRSRSVSRSSGLSRWRRW